MSKHRPLLAALCLSLLTGAVSAQAIWKWRDANGTLQVSDQPPPAGVPEKNILSRPGSSAPAVQAVADAAPEGATPSKAGSGSDNELEARKRKADAERQAATARQQQADKQREAALKADNCQRATNQLAALDKGQRIARPNAQGEREFLDDAGRAQEAERMRRIVAANCR